MTITSERNKHTCVDCDKIATHEAYTPTLFKASFGYMLSWYPVCKYHARMYERDGFRTREINTEEA